jgi:holin-like protein
MLHALTLILACQLAGEIIVRTLAIPVPGPVLGMLLLLAWLFLLGGISDDVGQTADRLLGNLSLLFVPAGVGVMVHWQRVEGEWLAIAVALIVGTLVAMAVTALTMTAVRRWTAARTNRGKHNG